MRTIRNVYSAICSFENIYRAYQMARRGKRFLPYVVDFERRLEENLLTLAEQLRDRTYKPGRYRAFWIREPKPRLISAAPLRDRVVHHALIDVIEPTIDRSFIEDSNACRRGKGNHAAVDRCQRYLRRFPWVLKCDIRKYFPSIDHQILYGLLKRRISDPDVLWLIFLILDTSNKQEPVQDLFPGDDLFTPLQRRRGLPIGNLTSQFFANVYLDGLDRYVKQQLRCKGYVRYMDDFIVFGDSKEELNEVRLKLRRYLQTLRLRMHERKQEIFPSTNGASFLGFHVLPGTRRLLGANIKRFKVRTRKLLRAARRDQLNYATLERSIAGWIGHACHGNTWRLRQDLFRSFGLGGKWDQSAPVECGAKGTEGQLVPSNRTSVPARMESRR